MIIKKYIYVLIYTVLFYNALFFLISMIVTPQNVPLHMLYLYVLCIHKYKIMVTCSLQVEYIST